MKIPTTWNESQLLSVNVMSSTSSSSAEEPCGNKPQQASVRFAAAEDLCTVHEVLSCQDYTEEEVEACWYNKSAYKHFKKDSIKTIQLWRSFTTKEPLPADQYCMRGLECRTREGAQQRKQVKHLLRSAAMAEIQRQLAEGISDAQTLASVCQCATAPQQHQASVQGMCDELEVREYSSLAQSIKPLTLARRSSSSAALQLQGIFHGQPSLTVVGGAAA